MAHKAAWIRFCLLPFILLAAWPLKADGLQRWLQQTIYVPLYSHIYADDRFKDKPFALTATLSVRNASITQSLLLDAVDYYDSDGKLLRSYLDKPLAIKPLASTRFIVRESDKGGSGAKFIVSWHSEVPLPAPIVESIMIGTKMQQGISFVSQGHVIDGTLSK